MIRAFTAGLAGALAFAAAAAAQLPQGITTADVNRELPREGAPLGVAGPYKVVAEPAGPKNQLFRPVDLTAFPHKDKLPIMLWGNGGCAANAGRFAGFLEDIASHGFLVITTAGPAAPAPAPAPTPSVAAAAGAPSGAPAGPPVRATADDLKAGLDWAFAENKRAGSPLAGKIDTKHVAAMGVSCGGVMALSLAGDPRVKSVGVYNSGVREAQPGAQASPMTNIAALKTLHGPTIYLNGGEPDFMMKTSEANFEAIKGVPIFYGSRANAGHSATYYHPGGGEFANVTVAWLKWQFKGDKEAKKAFVGAKCALCTNANWTVKSKGLK
jgi:dienelactone hydrolase